MFKLLKKIYDKPHIILNSIFFTHKKILSHKLKKNIKIIETKYFCNFPNESKYFEMYTIIFRNANIIIRGEIEVFSY